MDYEDFKEYLNEEIVNWSDYEVSLEPTHFLKPNVDQKKTSNIENYEFKKISLCFNRKYKKAFDKKTRHLIIRLYHAFVLLIVRRLYEPIKGTIPPILLIFETKEEYEGKIAFLDAHNLVKITTKDKKEFLVFNERYVIEYWSETKYTVIHEIAHYIVYLYRNYSNEDGYGKANRIKMINRKQQTDVYHNITWYSVYVSIYQIFYGNEGLDDRFSIRYNPNGSFYKPTPNEYPSISKLKKMKEEELIPYIEMNNVLYTSVYTMIINNNLYTEVDTKKMYNSLRKDKTRYLFVLSEIVLLKERVKEYFQFTQDL